jgi:hypothetical protein
MTREFTSKWRYEIWTTLVEKAIEIYGRVACFEYLSYDTFLPLFYIFHTAD